MKIGDMIKAEDVEMYHVAAVLSKVGNLSRCADVTGISRRTLHRKLIKWGIKNPASNKRK